MGMQATAAQAAARMATTPRSTRLTFDGAIVAWHESLQPFAVVQRLADVHLGPAVIAQLVDELAVDAETVAQFERLIAQRKSELGS